MIEDIKFRQAMGQFATGVTVITTEYGQEVIGMTANAFMSISLDPKIVAVSIGEQASMYEILSKTNKFGVSFLREDQQDMSELFAREDEYGQRDMFTFKKDIPVLKDCLAHLTCHVMQSTKAGDHLVYFGEVKDLEIFSGEPILYYGSEYRKLSK